MAKDPEHNPVSPEALELGYQPEAMNARWLAWFLVGFVVITVGLGVLIWSIMGSMERHNRKADVPRSVVTFDQHPPAPNLQPSVGHDSTAGEDLAALRQREDALFTRMGWSVNPSTHEIGIPPDIVQRVAEEARARAAGPSVPPTTTGKETNSVAPGQVPPYDTRPGVNGGQRP